MLAVGRIRRKSIRRPAIARCVDAFHNAAVHMMSLPTRRLFAGAALASAVSSCADHARSAPDTAAPDPNQLRAIVQEFYDWYTPIAHEQRGRPAYLAAIGGRTSQFSQELLTSLGAEFQDRARDPLHVGLTVDPFLQDAEPRCRYEVRKVQPMGDVYLAEIARMCAEQREGTVLAQLMRFRDHWQFSDFGDAKSGVSLRATLRCLHGWRDTSTTVPDAERFLAGRKADGDTLDLAAIGEHRLPMPRDSAFAGRLFDLVLERTILMPDSQSVTVRVTRSACVPPRFASLDTAVAMGFHARNGDTLTLFADDDVRSVQFVGLVFPDSVVQLSVAPGQQRRFSRRRATVTPEGS